MTPTQAHFPYLNSDGSRSHRPEMVMQFLGLANGGYYFDLLKEWNPAHRFDTLRAFQRSLEIDFEPDGYYEKVNGDTGTYTPHTDFPYLGNTVQIQFAFPYTGLLCFVEKEV